MKNKRFYLKLLTLLAVLATASVAIGYSVAQAQPKQPAMEVSKPASMDAMATAPVMAPATPMDAPKASQPESTKGPAEAKPAPSKAQDPWWKTLVGGLIQILLLFVLSFAIVLGKLGIQWVSKKLKITDAEKIASFEKLYDSAVTFGVNYARQKAHTLRDNPNSKGERINWATEQALDLMKEWELPQKSANWVAKKIEAKIGEQERQSNKTA